MKRVASYFLSAHRNTKRAISIVLDFAMLSFACWFAIVLRLGTPIGLSEHIAVFILAPLCAVPVMIRMGLYRAVIRYVGYTAIWTIVRSVTLGVLIWALVVTLFDLFVPRSSILIYWMAALVFVGGTRMFGRWLFRQLTDVGRSYKNRHALRALIYGAGASGQQMVQAFMHSKEISSVGFLDDDQSIQGSEILGLRVFSFSDIESLIERYGVDTVLLSSQKISSKRKREIVHALDSYPVAVKVVPGIDQVARGSITVNDIADIDVADLLGRDCVAAKPELLSTSIFGKNVMVTGAGGSIGSELCRQIIRQKPICLVLFELSEFALYTVERDLKAIIDQSNRSVEIIAILGNVQDIEHLQKVMMHYHVHTVYHAAAYKHVPIVEHNLISGIRNNVFGSWHTAEAAVISGVENFVLVSTDKAVRPTNVMGATKRLAELVLQGMALREGHSTRLSMVRFGNVLGSSGSVIPVFRQQINEGGPITVTHPEITRFFMTIPEAASLVIQAGSMGGTGDVFVLDMGEPVKIVDLAKEMISLAGCSLRSEENPEGDIEIVYCGLRKGEKLYEELLIGSNVLGTSHPMIMRAQEEALNWEQMESILGSIQALINEGDYEGLQRCLLSTVTGYSSSEGLSDYLYQPGTSTCEQSRLVN